MALWKDGAFADDAYRLAPDGEPLPDGPVIVSLGRFLAEREALLARNEAVGVLLQPSDRLEPIADDLKRLPLLALSFPKFGDGRAFSLARLARERYGFDGELRAVGDVLFDRIGHMLRCGFTALEISNEPTIAELKRGRLPLPQESYQPTGSDPADEADRLRPWRRPSRRV
jgi:uncharacterized protein (DUF934 family)